MCLTEISLEAYAKIIQMKNFKIKVLDDDQVISRFENIGWSNVGTAVMVSTEINDLCLLLIKWAHFT